MLSFRTLDEQIAASLTQERLVATLAGFFGVLGLLLAAVGLYGVTSYAVTSRGAEIGIRMALGASSRGVVAMVLRRVAWLVGTGIVLGAGLSMWAATFIRTLLYGLDARDPVTFVSAAALLDAGRGDGRLAPRAPRRAHRSDAGAEELVEEAGIQRLRYARNSATSQSNSQLPIPTPDLGVGIGNCWTLWIAELRRRASCYDVRSAVDGSTRAARRAGR